MAFPYRAIFALMLISFNAVCSSDADHEVRTAFAVSQMALSEQSSALAQHSKALGQQSEALSRILQSLEQSQVDSQGMSQTLVQMAQGFQETLNQLTQELSRQQLDSLSQLTKELFGQQSSHVGQIAEEMGQLFRTSLSHQSEILNATLKSMSESLEEAINRLSLEQGSQRSLSQSQISEMSQSLLSSQNQLSQSISQSITATNNDLRESMTEGIQEISQAVHQVANLSRCGVPAGFRKISDGWFTVVKVKKSWKDARQHCQELGVDLASPPTDFGAFKAYVDDTAGREAWIGGRLVGSSEWIYVNGVHVNMNSHWSPGEPAQGEECMMMGHSQTLPLHGVTCPYKGYFVCRYG